MSKADWCIVNPQNGSGSKVVNVSSNSEHTGRVARTTQLTIKAAGVSNKYVTVNQAGKPEFVENTSDTATAIKTGQSVTISGKSNSSKLTFKLGTGNLPVTLPATYIAAGIKTNNGANISNDIGATTEYDWSIVLSVAENTTTTEKSIQLIVTDAGGNTDTCVLTQAAGDSYLDVKKDGVSITTIELNWRGDAVSFDVESNTSWNIS